MDFWRKSNHHLQSPEMMAGTQHSKNMTAHGKQITHQYQRQQKAAAQPLASFWFLIPISLAPLTPPCTGMSPEVIRVSLPAHLRTHISRWLRAFSCLWTFQTWGRFNSTVIMWKESKLPLPQIATGYRLQETGTQQGQGRQHTFTLLLGQLRTLQNTWQMFMFISFTSHVRVIQFWCGI